ncbi:MAG: diguanylate cyclase [Sulfuricellaceae bacterium]|nr:diguanylate cyclase [Sulfuricellaceae bacterium]
MMLLATRRAAMIISRVRLVAALFAILTPLWIVVDWWVFPRPLWGWLATGRVASSVMLASLAFLYKSSTSMSRAYLALVILFSIPTAFFIFAHSHLYPFHLDGMAAVVQTGYTFLPFVLVAGLSVFPLTVVEGLVFSFPALLAIALPVLINPKVGQLGAFLGTFWLLLVIAVVSTLAGMSQLGFMINLVRQAIRDPLTGSFSRLSGEELLEIQFIISVRSHSPLSVAFIDLDDFKAVNDLFGHEAGDRVLIATAEQIRRKLRTGDMLARWGGEEFVLIMPNTYAGNAVAVLERLRASGLGFRPDGRAITASIGLAERIEDNIGEWRVLVDAADQRMYAAKQSGKDRIMAGPHDLVASSFTGGDVPAPTPHAREPAPRDDPGAVGAP